MPIHQAPRRERAAGPWKRAFAVCCLAVLWPLAPTALAHDGWKGGPRRPPPPEPLVCQAGQQACQGRYGSACFMPARGETCAGGMVCSAGLRACLGPHGASCYRPASGQTCQQGLVCGVGQSVCVSAGGARCYTPSRGETCH